MSQKNPNVAEIRANVVDKFDMSKHLHKSYLNLAKGKFAKKHKRGATLNDAQELFDMFVVEWKHYYKTIPLLEKAYKKIATPVWTFGCSIKINVQDSTREFVRTVNPEFKNVFKHNYAAWIIRKGLFKEYKQFARKNKKKFRYVRYRYTDFSHLAYNGVTDDF